MNITLELDISDVSAGVDFSTLSKALYVYSERPRTGCPVCQTGRKSVRLSIVRVSNVGFIYSERSECECLNTERSVHFFH